MPSYFSQEFFKENRVSLQKLFRGSAPIVVTANGLLQKSGDNTYKFKQDANFWYLTGINLPDIILVIDKGKEYLIVPELSSMREIFDGRIDYSALTKTSGISEIYNAEEGWSKLANRIKKVNHIATIAAPKGYIEAYGFYTNPARRRLIRRIKAVDETVSFLDLSKHFASLRMIKHPEEIQAIQEAIKITGDSIKEATKPSLLSKYKYEYELEANLTKAFRSRGASGHAFDPVVACGINACTIHYIENNDRLDKSNLVLMDIGAEVENYAADISRTISLSKPTKRQRDVYAAVLDTQEYAISLLKPGKLIREYEDQVENYMGEKLRALGLIKTITHQNVRKYFPYLTSHFLGLNVHDVGIYDKELEPGVVMTVEPGIHIPEEGIGVRIEDNILITANGSKVLSANLPKSTLTI